MSGKLCFLASLVSRTPTTEVHYLGQHIHRVKKEKKRKAQKEEEHNVLVQEIKGRK
jgi:hypothetical protein